MDGSRNSNELMAQTWARVGALWGGVAPDAAARFTALEIGVTRVRGQSWVPEQGALAVLIADWWTQQQGRAAQTQLVLGVSGAQGTGKSTLVAHLATALANLGQRVAVLSLDDLYLSHAARAQLAVAVHPLLATRGVPGTHDVESGLRLLDALAQNGDVPLPRFDKASDDPAPLSSWPVVQAPCDTVLLEGWCVGIPPQDMNPLRIPCNTLEQNEDPRGIWREFVNAQLTTRYAPLFARCAKLIALLPPDFAAIQRWRGWQEQELPQEKRMSDASLARFVAHYERLTRHGIAMLPERADVVIRLAADHTIAAIGHRPV